MRTTLSIFTLIFLLTSPLLAVPADDDKPATEEAAAEEETYENALRWKTATEVDNFGFDVFRATAEEGPFERLNDKPILGAGTTDEPSSYEFIDDDIDPYQTYWYYLESIDMDGGRERFTPVFRKKPKLPAEEE